VAEHQPTKLAAIEALWDDQAAGSSPAWTLLASPDEASGSNRWSLSVPGAFSWILETRPQLSQPLRGLNSWPADQRPHMVGLLFYAFRVMVAIGLAATALMALSLLLWWRGGLSAASFARWPWFSWAWILSAPAGYLAIESGWVVRCVGRQPWTVYGQLRTADAASVLPVGEVLTSLSVFAVLYTVLLVFALYFGSRIIANRNWQFAGRWLPSHLSGHGALGDPYRCRRSLHRLPLDLGEPQQPGGGSHADPGLRADRLHLLDSQNQW
jgi:cytochrome d ubiquinol oxidase subunit I